MPRRSMRPWKPACSDLIERSLADADALCIEDYNKGLVTESVCREAIARARKRGLPVLVDPARSPISASTPAPPSLKPNRPETARANGAAGRTSPSEYQAAAEWLLEKLQLEAATITLDKRGVYLATRDGERQWIRSRERQGL